MSGAIKISGIQLLCDACGHTVPVEGEVTEKHIGTPCPKCGADMLTREDFEAGQKMQEGITAFNAVMAALGIEGSEQEEDYVSTPFRVNPRANKTTIAFGEES